MTIGDSTKQEIMWRVGNWHIIDDVKLVQELVNICQSCRNRHWNYYTLCPEKEANCLYEKSGQIVLYMTNKFKRGMFLQGKVAALISWGEHSLYL